MPKYTYKFEGFWVTTDEDLTDYLEKVEVTDQEAELIDEGGIPDEIIPVFIEERLEQEAQIQE